MVDVTALAQKGTAQLLPLLRRGLASFAKALVVGFGLTLLAVLLAASQASRHGEFAPRLLAAALVALVGVSATLLLSSKHAVVVVAAQALERLALGNALFQVVFRYLLNVTDEQASGQRLGAVGNALETRIPLAQAEARLRAAIAKVSLERSELEGMRGWLLAKVRGRILRTIERLTLTRFRRDNQQRGAIDLLQVRDELGQGLDDVLVAQILALSTRTTLLFSGIAIALCAAITWTIHWA